MTRKIRYIDPDEKTPDECEVAPHRYKWDGSNSSNPYADTIKEWRKTVPYQPGDVVYVDVGEDEPKKALITHIILEYDLYGDRREAFKIRFETKSGTWSKLWNYAWPGSIQRGYVKADLAPDIPVSER